MQFEDLDLSYNILDALCDMQFEECTPIQAATIPHILEGHDVLGIAQTGTGKTAAYLLPILSLLDDNGYAPETYGASHRTNGFSSSHVNCVIMSPTRELAQQIDQAMQGFGYYLDNVSSHAVYGGNDGQRFAQEQNAMRNAADIIIATPGRLISHMQLGNLDLSHCAFFVLDEADRMLDMGFADDIMLIAKQLPQTCQNIMFSATMPEKIEQMAHNILNKPVKVKLAVSKPAEKIKQNVFICQEKQKTHIVEHLFKENKLQRTILFAGKKTAVKDIAAKLQRMNVSCGAMHSDLAQSERDDIMFRFKSGQVSVLVATDIVSRGIDIDNVDMVINYDVPHDAEDYVHRIGRTARAQREGAAITLVARAETIRLNAIERFLGKKIERLALPENIPSFPEESNAKGKERSGRRKAKMQESNHCHDDKTGRNKRNKGNGRRRKSHMRSEKMNAPETSQSAE